MSDLVANAMEIDDDASVFVDMGAIPEEDSALFSARMADRKKLPSAPLSPVVVEKPSGTRWGPQPSVANQVARMPDSVRMGRRTTMVLNLSNEADLMKFNDLQHKSSNENPTAVIVETDHKFHDGNYHCRVTYAEVEYAQL